MLYGCLQDLLFNLRSLTEWLKSYWYWVLAGFAGLSKTLCMILPTIIGTVVPIYRDGAGPAPSCPYIRNIKFSLLIRF